MIKIIDSTLTKLDNYILDRESLYLFCDYMKEIGIKDLQISTKAYQIMEQLPEGINFYLKLEAADKINEFPGVYKYIISKGIKEENCINAYQLNDAKEILSLKSLIASSTIEIIGLDDLMCYDYKRIFEEILNTLKDQNIIFSPENSYNCATALAVQWLLFGGDVVSTSFNGIGNMAATEEVYVSMRVVNRYKPNQKLSVFEKLSKLFEDITSIKIEEKKPIIGSKIFQVESGIHVDGILKNPSNYEPYNSELVGKKTEIVIGKHSGSNSIKMKCKEYGYNITDKKQISEILYKVKILSVNNKRSLTEKEFLDIVQEVTFNGTKEDC